jgi:CRP-like cAMP-binding protein
LTKQTTIISALAGVNAFNDLDHEQLKLLAEHFTEHTISAGKAVITEGQKGTHLYVIVQGEVQVLLPSQGGTVKRPEDVLLAQLGVGELFGEYSWVDMRPASASVVALQDCRLLQIEHAQLHKILDEHCAIARRFLENLVLVLIDRLREDDRALDVFAG